MIREPEDLPERIADMPRGRALSALQILADSTTTIVRTAQLLIRMLLCSARVFCELAVALTLPLRHRISCLCSFPTNTHRGL